VIILWTYYKNEILKFVIWILLFIWCLTTSIAFIVKKDQIVFVKFSADSVEIIKDLSQEDEGYLEKIFLKRFSQLHYTYDSDNFISNISDSSNFIEPTLWSEINKKFQTNIAYFQDKQISCTSVIEKIVRKDNFYEVVLNLVTQENSRTLKSKLKVKIELKKVPRTIKNPFGFQVVKLDESEVIL